MSIGIYKIENLINHKIYIGQSVHIEKRFLEHCKKSSSSLISTAISKYGKDNFSFTIIEECTIEELNDKEEYYIKKYNSITPYGYNITLPDKESGNQVFANYDKDIFHNIISDIKSSDLSFKQIASKYNLDLSMIYYLNRGDYHTLENENYPLREVKDLSKKENFCKDCHNPIANGSTRCIECYAKIQRKVERPNRDELKTLIRSTSFVELGKRFGVSDKAIVKWCKSYNLPSKRKDIKDYSDSQWKEI